MHFLELVNRGYTGEAISKDDWDMEHVVMTMMDIVEEYDLSGKTILPFCSHGGGRFGQSLTAIAKLAPRAVIREGLSVHYSGGSGLKGSIAKWLAANGVNKE